MMGSKGMGDHEGLLDNGSWVRIKAQVQTGSVPEAMMGSKGMGDDQRLDNWFRGQGSGSGSVRGKGGEVEVAVAKGGGYTGEYGPLVAHLGVEAENEVVLGLGPRLFLHAWVKVIEPSELGTNKLT